jgi:hypothetical protein
MFDSAVALLLRFFLIVGAVFCCYGSENLLLVAMLNYF